MTWSWFSKTSGSENYRMGKQGHPICMEGLWPNAWTMRLGDWLPSWLPLLLQTGKQEVWDSRSVDTKEGFPRGRKQPRVQLLELLSFVEKIMEKGYLGLLFEGLKSFKEILLFERSFWQEHHQISPALFSIDCENCLHSCQALNEN